MKKGLLITLIIILILIAGGYGTYYYLTNKDVKPEAIGVAEDFFEFESMIEEMLDPSSSLRDPQGEAMSGSESIRVEPALGSSESSSINPGSNNSDASHSGNKVNASTDQPEVDHQPVTEDQIRAKYEPIFRSLEEVALARLDALVQNAYAEYQSNSNSLVDISSRYMSAGNKLQNKVDNAFYSLLEKLKSELKDADLSMNLVNEVEVNYHQAIRSKKSEIMDKAYEFIG